LKIYNLSGIIEDFSKQITAELDFVRDGKNAEILAENMKGMKGIHIPKIYWEFTGKRLLVMEYIEGVRIDDLAGLKKLGINTRTVALNGLHAYLKQIFQDGFFHGDPHSGNLLVMKNGDIAFLDFGLIGVLRPEKRDLLLRMLMGVINSDINDLTRVFLLLGIRIKEEWIDLFKDDLYVSLMEGKNDSFDSQKPDTDAFVGITNTLRKYRLQVPVVTMLMIKVIMMVGDYISTIDPEFDFMDEVKPYLGKIVKNSMVDSAKNTLLSLPVTAHEISEIPRSINDASRQISNGALFVRLSNSDVDRLGNHIDRAVNKILIVGSLMFILGIILYLYIF
jgi:ubiquinone biosynthesis protein